MKLLKKLIIFFARFYSKDLSKFKDWAGYKLYPNVFFAGLVTLLYKFNEGEKYSSDIEDCNILKVFWHKYLI